MITGDCGPHCGIRGNAEDTIRREGHCRCGDPCHRAAPAPASITAGTIAGAVTARSRPMCWAWYEATGGVKPWEHPEGART